MSDATNARKTTATRHASASVTDEVVLALVRQNEALVAALVQLTALSRPEPQVYPNFTDPSLLRPLPDEAEDAHFMHRAGLINDEELASVLRQSGFPSADVTLG